MLHTSHNFIQIIQTYIDTIHNLNYFLWLLCGPPPSPFPLHHNYRQPQPPLSITTIGSLSPFHATSKGCLSPYPKNYWSQHHNYTLPPTPKQTTTTECLLSSRVSAPDPVFCLDPEPVFKFLWILIQFLYPAQDPRRKSVQKLFTRKKLKNYDRGSSKNINWERI